MKIRLALSLSLVLAAGCQRKQASTMKEPGGMVAIPIGDFEMGTSDGVWFEAPPHQVQVKAFWMDIHEVSNSDFEAFVDEAGYRTEAEEIGSALVFAPGARGWTSMKGAFWRHPEGRESKLAGRMDHPVVHVSHRDADAYCRHLGKRLPSEPEWAWAARGGLTGARFPWGNELTYSGAHMANTWQGAFPDRDEVLDGFDGVAPRGSFPPNGYGLHDMAGNVWEWTATAFSPYSEGPAASGSAEPLVIRGGSWMCSPHYCEGYRVAARQKSDPDSALNNLGFRCARDS